MINVDQLLTDRVQSIDASGIRKIFELGASLKDPVNLSIGQPDFPVPQPIKQAAIDAINNDHNGYTLTQGIPALREAIADRLRDEIGWDVSSESSDLGLLITSGTSGALLLSFMALAEAGDEIIFADPYFVVYPYVARMVGAKPIFCDTYPDFRLTAARLEPLITARTKFVLVNSPGNPSGVVLSNAELREIVELCDSKGVMVISDEIYDEFTFADGREDGVFPTPARFSDRMLLVRGFGKTYGLTGWRLGYAAGPKALIGAMAKLQQYSFVCAPSMVQHAGVEALRTDMSKHVAAYAKKRDMVIKALGAVTEVSRPAGAFYAFPKVPEHLGLTATDFVTKAIEKNVLTIPGNIFSERDTHFRLSYATTDEKLKRGLDVLAEMMR